MLRRTVHSDLFPRGTPSFIHRGLLRGHGTPRGTVPSDLSQAALSQEGSAIRR